MSPNKGNFESSYPFFLPLIEVFDEMFDIPRSYISACFNSVQYVRLHPILMSILLYHYKQLTECISQVEQMMVTV
jgi:hypothetical protein